MSIAATAALVLSWPAAPALAAPDDGEQLGGYKLSTSAAPVSVLLYEDTLPIPAEPQGEAHLSYTETSMNTGPTGRAVASSLWPGPTIAEGLPQFTGSQQTQYPIKAIASYPGGQQDVRKEPAPGTGMRAHAGEDAFRATARVGEPPVPGNGGETPAPEPTGSAGPAPSTPPAPGLTAGSDGRNAQRSSGGGASGSPSAGGGGSGLPLQSGGSGLPGLPGGELPGLPSPFGGWVPWIPDPTGGGVPGIPGLVGLDNVASVSESALDSGTATSSARATASSVNLLGGLVRVEGLRVQSTASSDGQRGEADSEVTIGSLTVAGQEVAVDESGVQLPQVGSGQNIPEVPGQLEDQLGQLGISIQPPKADHNTSEAEGSATSQGLRITIDTQKLRGMLDALPQDQLTELLPEQLAAEIAPVLGMAPKIVLVVGNGSADASATPPFDAAAPAPPPASPPAPGGSGPDPGSIGGSSGTASGAGDAGGPALAGSSSGSGGAAPGAGQKARPALASFDGIPGYIVVLGISGAALCAWGLRRLSTLILGAGSCDLGSANGVPDLREM